MNLITKITNRKKYNSPKIEIEDINEDIVTTSSYQEEKVYKEKTQLKRFSNPNQEREFLEDQIENFFPRNGHWRSWCFNKVDRLEVSEKYFPCHLRDNLWLSQLLVKKIKDSYQIEIPYGIVLNFISNSKRFEELRHEYELEVVRWQINWMINGGENWLLPEGFSELSPLFGTDYDICFRGGVVKTLKAIGMNENVIQEGIEKYAAMWRNKCMNRAFNQEFAPIMMFKKQIEESSSEFKQNWLKYRKYQYYSKHKYYVDHYGEVEPEMLINGEDLIELEQTLNQQIEERKKQIKEWENSITEVKSIKLNTGDKLDL